ncbi:hypothetical protein TNCV_1048381 [Trichonephila clavipes]|nr:hypothetical protein TNCV_1048381 [Trichonephila clavipes]
MMDRNILSALMVRTPSVGPAYFTRDESGEFSIAAACESFVRFLRNISITSDVSKAVTVATPPCSFQFTNQDAPSQSRPLHLDIGGRGTLQALFPKDIKRSLTPTRNTFSPAITTYFETACRT